MIDLTDSQLTELIRGAVDSTEKGNTGTALVFANKLRAAGVVGGLHVGKKNMKPREILEWYCGQYISIADSGAWYAMNSFINCLDKFAPEILDA